MWYVGVVISFFLYFSGFISVYLFIRRRLLKRYIAIVLMYHRIGKYEKDQDITVSPERFEDQMKYLKKHMEVVSLDKILEIKKRHLSLHRDIVAITFDDGYKDNYINAYPILRRYNIPATIFIITGLIDKNRDMLNREEIVLMHKEGNIMFGAHTATHRILSELDKYTAWIEIKDSKLTLEEILGDRVKYFAYPYGKRKDVSDETVQIVKEAGFYAAFSTENGYITKDSDIFKLNRLGIRNFPLFVFKVRISGIFENKYFSILRRYLNII